MEEESTARWVVGSDRVVVQKSSCQVWIGSSGSAAGGDRGVSKGPDSVRGAIFALTLSEDEYIV